MKRRLITLFVINLMIFSMLEAHPWKPDHYVIIDTDCGLDDFRAINLMMASPNIRILAIIASNGVIQSEEGYQKIKSLLNTNYHEGILVGLNDDKTQSLKNCKPALEFNWGSRKAEYDTHLYNAILNQVFENSSEKVTFINLGGLSTYYEYFRNNPQYKKRVEDIIWTVDTKNLKKSFNYLIDSVAYNKLEKDKRDITLIDGASFGYYTHELINILKITDEDINSSLTLSGSDFTRAIYDEAVVFYLLSKDVFSVDTAGGTFNYSLKSNINIVKAYSDLLSSLKQGQTQVFSKFSTDTSDYMQDIQLIMDSTIERFGKEEWSACVLTSELHRHLGVYSLVGAKMGIRAKEYFGAGADELKIVSYAGLTPPFSCLNDGLQVSTGATLGHGLISVDKDTKLPKADFEYLGQTISISLKDEYREKIASEIKELSLIYGLDSNIYWDLVRKLALKYWSEWDRHELFEIEEK